MSYRGWCITLFTTASTQEFLFRSNKLKENAGASEMVRDAMEDWWQDRLGGGKPIFVGGGGAAYLFPSKTIAIEQVKLWSRKWLERAPGLRFVAAHQEIQGSEKEAYKKAQEKLREHEERAPFGFELGALPVVRECQSTGLAASERESGPGQAWLSAEAQAKREYDEKARGRLSGPKDKGGYGDVLKKFGYQFPQELSDLGHRKGASQIAIVHADGNGMGKLFNDVIKNAPDGDAFFGRLEDLSREVTKLARCSFRKTLRDFAEVYPDLRDQDEEIVLSLPKKDDGPPYLPLRPLVDSGDDLTFVCHGKYGLPLAVRYLEHFHNESSRLARFSDQGQKQWTACAGVLVMPEKFPFARGYRLVEKLTKGAKKLRRKDKENNGDACWIDFQVILEGGAGSLETIRQTLYPKFGDRAFLCRPYRLFRSNVQDEHSWERFEKNWELFQAWPRSRAKEMLEALAQDQDAVTVAGAGIRAAGHKFPNEEVHWTEYWDALEMLDFYRQAPWPKRKEEEHAAA